MSYIARFKGKGMHYSIMCPYQAIGTIDKKTFDLYSGAYKVRANQFVKTLIVNSYDEYNVIRNVYKRSK